MNVVARITDLKVHYPVRNGFLNLGEKKSVKAVDGVSLDLVHGEILGLVGESGCGKSSLGRAIIRLINPTSGQVELSGSDFLAMTGESLRLARKNIQMVFQDPYASLDPRMTIYDVLAEPLLAHPEISSDIDATIRLTMEKVGLSPRSLMKYPHEFSGGQRQRIAIARALILNPKVLIADEPVSSLDVSVQAQILNLLKDIQRERKLTMVFISHNLAVVRYIADRIAVMYLGKIVETASKAVLFDRPEHPYTKALISAVPVPDPKVERTRVRQKITGEIPSAMNPPKGCAFNTRCPLVTDRCRQETPPIEKKAAGSVVACFEVK